jgi:hypothetical protein
MGDAGVGPLIMNEYIPHFTIYRGSSRAHETAFGTMGVKGVHRRVKEIVDAYIWRRGGRALRGKVVGLQVLQEGEILDNFIFGY